MAEPNREKEIFEQALDIESLEARAAFIRQACGGDKALIGRIESLLKASETAPDFLPEGTIRVGPDQSGAGTSLEGPGTVIGRYKLLEQIGEGGFGYVYMAEQLEPVKRRVALKIIKPGMDSKQVIGRFEAERQALALMDHPNIAQIFDAGTIGPSETGSSGRESAHASPGESQSRLTSAATVGMGRPYFVMELVKGIPITKFCEERQLDLEARLKLLIQVCSAVQHAHQKGIIHRDLKPSNIMVALHGDQPVPKVIDFGIAKATQQPLTDKTVFTQFQQFLGTPAYMSPEQATLSGLDVDTRSDIYSLGVLLYELLTGSPPFDSKQLLSAGLDEMRKIIREKEPERPSTRIRRTSASGLQPQLVTRHSSLATDLDCIVMKCLEKERTRRYETANGLAEDLRRHLENEPVLARPPSRLYEFQKSVRRHKVGFAATTVVLLLLAVGVLVSTWQAARATRAEKRAQAEELVARRRAYVADMRTLGESLDHNPARARRLLNDYRPHPGQEDLRDFEWYYFNRVLSANESEILGAHPGGAMTLLTRPDGTFITAGVATNWVVAAGQMQVWDGVEGKLKSSLALPQVVPNGGAIAIALSHDGKRLAIAHPDLDIELRSMDQPDQLQTVLTNWHRGLRHNAWAMAMCFVDDDTQLAVGDWSVNVDKTSLPLTLVQIAADRTNPSRAFKPPLALDGLAVSRDGRRLAVKDDNGRILVLDFPGGKPVCRIETRGKRWLGVYPAMTFLNDPDFLVTTSISGQIEVWNLATTNRRTIGNHGSFVTALALSPDGTRLASAGSNQRIKVWDPHQSVQPPLRVLRGHTAPVFGVAFLPDGHTLVSCGADQAVRRWDLRRPGPDKGIWTLPPGAMYASIHVGLLGAVAPTRGRLAWKVWDVSHLSEPVRPRPLSPPASMPKAIVAPIPGTPYHLVWRHPKIDRPDRMFLYRRLDPPEPVAGFPEIWTDDPSFIQINKHLLMVHGASNGAPYDLVWDLTRRRVVHLVKSPRGFGNVHVAFASDGSFVILSDGGRLEKLDLATGATDVWNDATPGITTTLAILPDNRTVLAGSGLGMLCKLDFSTRQKRWVVGSPMGMQSMCLSPSGTRLAIGDKGGHVRLWDVPTLHEVVLLGTHPGAVTGLYFTPDGRNLLSVDATELRVWRTADH